MAQKMSTKEWFFGALFFLMILVFSFASDYYFDVIALSPEEAKETELNGQLEELNRYRAQLDDYLTFEGAEFSHNKTVLMHYELIDELNGAKEKHTPSKIYERARKLACKKPGRKLMGQGFTFYATVNYYIEDEPMQMRITLDKCVRT